MSVQRFGICLGLALALALAMLDVHTRFSLQEVYNSTAWQLLHRASADIAQLELFGPRHCVSCFLQM